MQGSNTCAVDSANKLYSIGNKSPYPLMKYSIATDKWTTIKDLGIGGNRLDFNVKMAYFIIQNQVQYISLILLLDL
jgi:hypothetical protein